MILYEIEFLGDIFRIRLEFSKITEKGFAYEVTSVSLKTKVLFFFTKWIQISWGWFFNKKERSFEKIYLFLRDVSEARRYSSGRTHEIEAPTDSQLEYIVQRTLETDLHRYTEAVKKSYGLKPSI